MEGEKDMERSGTKSATMRNSERCKMKEENVCNVDAGRNDAFGEG